MRVTFFGFNSTCLLLLGDELTDTCLVTWTVDYLTGRHAHMQYYVSDSVVTAQEQGTILTPFLCKLWTSEPSEES